MTTMMVEMTEHPVPDSGHDDTERIEVRFPAGLVGFPDYEDYTLVGGEGGVFELLPKDPDGPGFVVVAAALFYPDYQPVLDDGTAERLDLLGADEALVLVIVTVGSDVSAAYGNLFAPVVVNTRTGSAAQVLLSGQDFPLRAPLAVAGQPS
jgi:flagellar assembly factor FliW